MNINFNLALNIKIKYFDIINIMLIYCNEILHFQQIFNPMLSIIIIIEI